MPDLSSAKSGAMNLMKGGWHPDKNDKGKETWHRPTQWGAAGREEKRRTQAAHSHVSQPITQLQDPASFGAPPKRGDSWNTGGESAAEATRAVAGMVATVGGAAPASRALPPVPPEPSSAVAQQTGTHPAGIPSAQQPAPRPGPAVPPRTGTGLSTKSATPSSRYGSRSQPEDPEEPAEPSGPFRVDTTGLSTANLPPPPVHRDRRAPGSPPVKPGTGSSLRSPPTPARNAKPFVPTRNPVPAVSRTANPTPPARPKPNLPPRAAVAGGTNEDPDVDNDPPPPYSVKPNPVTNAAPSVNELQQRFARMNAAQEEGLGGDGAHAESAGADANVAPPPVPIGTKPK